MNDFWSAIMSRNVEFWDAIATIREGDDRYAPEAYSLVMEALEYTIQNLGEHRHVNASELMDGLKRYARSRYGLLAADVLGRWGVEHASDVGTVVFQMVDAGVLARQDSDRLDEFEAGGDLRAGLEEDYFE